MEDLLIKKQFVSTSVSSNTYFTEDNRIVEFYSAQINEIGNKGDKDQIDILSPNRESCDQIKDKVLQALGGEVKTKIEELISSYRTQLRDISESKPEAAGITQEFQNWKNNEASHKAFLLDLRNLLSIIK